MKDPAMTDDPNADLVEMLCAAEPSLDAEWFEGSVKEQHPITLWPNGLQRLLAWANARRDAAVEAKQTDSRDAQIAHEVVEVAARVADPTGWGWYDRSAVDTNKYTQETRGSFHERTTRAMRCALAVAAPLMMDARDAQIARLREALAAAQAHIAGIREQDFDSFTVDGDPTTMDEDERSIVQAHDDVLSTISAALSDTEARDA